MDYLVRNYRAPALLIGHSLGGAAVIFASKEKPSVKAVVTIGTPATTDHVLKLFAAEMHRLQEEGFADVTIGGRKFRIRDQFVQDVQDSELNIIIKDLQKALLILHAPQDRVVGVENAAKIYKWARHPKSFISLDGADHILSSKDDGLYAGEVIAAWVMRYLEVSLIKDKPIQTMHQVAVRLHNEDGYTTDIKTAGHSLLADEPESVGGQFLGPGPYELLMASLGSCTVMTLHMYARRKKWPLEEVTTHLNFSREHAEDSEHCGNKDNYLNQFELILEIKGDLTQSQVQRLFEIAGKCPVHKTLKGRIHIELKLADAT
jgi:putative redox protein